MKLTTVSSFGLGRFALCGASATLASLAILLIACDGGDTRLELSAEDTFSFSTATLVAPADAAFTVVFDNQDDGEQHNFSIGSGGEGLLYSTEIEEGPVVQELEVGGLEAGEYFFRCEVWPTTMTGTLTVE